LGAPQWSLGRQKGKDKEVIDFKRQVKKDKTSVIDFKSSSIKKWES